jgi:putative endonuclease
MARTQGRGKLGEEAAQRYLEAQGYRLVDVNVRFSREFDAGGELDIIAWDGETLCFIEVKTRSGKPGVVAPAEAITLAKQRQIARLAEIYLAESGLYAGTEEISYRFDTVSVYLAPPVAHSSEITIRAIELVQGAFLAS